MRSWSSLKRNTKFGDLPDSASTAKQTMRIRGPTGDISALLENFDCGFQLSIAIARDFLSTVEMVLYLSLFLLSICSQYVVFAAENPNIVLLLTDDQDLLLGGMSPIARTLAFLSDGAYLKNFFVNTPVCCPSRATLISGRFPHNTLYNHSADPNGLPSCMHMNASSSDFEEKSIGKYMKKLGYRTGQFGKYLNEPGVKPYCKDSVPLPGFDRWFTMCNTDMYYGNEISDNGKFRTYGHEPSDYLTAIIANATLNFLEDVLKEKEEPFFAYIAPHAPHVPATPAPEYENTLPYMMAPHSPIYNFTATDHHGIVKLQSPMDPFQIAPEIDELFRNRWRSLLSVDDLMMDVVKKLDQYNQLDNTYFLFTSDHGYQLGQFNLPSCKLQPYEHDIRVPMFVKGPGITKSSPAFVAGMVDIAPTIITLAGGTPPDTMDGHSFENMIKKSGQSSDIRESTWRDKHTLEYWSLGNVVRYQHFIDGPNNTYIGVRLVNETHNYLYVEYHENKSQRYFTEPAIECELFDMSVDPYQKVNLYGTDKEDKNLVNELHFFLQQQLMCSGSNCV